jgi:hypothetical protein
MARNTVLEHGGKSFVSDTAKADVFIKHYASVSCQLATSSLGLIGRLTMSCILD